MNRVLFSLAAAAGLAASAASAQVVINEVFVNPPGSGSVDDVWEYIELYGAPGASLNGYAIAQVMGGADPDGDDVPGPLPIDFDPEDHLPEIDEAFHLDGLSLGANGMLVLYNTNAGGFSNVVPLLPAETTRAPWKMRHIPSPGDPAAGRFRNDGSCTFVLIRRRAGHSISETTGQSVYGAAYRWRKDECPDVDYDGMIDCGDETPIASEAPVHQLPPAVALAVYQMVDDVAWSHSGGKEYVRSSEQEISNTDGFNPDAITRLAFYPENPMRGHRFNGAGELVPTRMADEEWVYGEVPVITGLVYDNSIDGEGFRQVKGPTDQNGPIYDGSCNPDDPSQACPPAPGGEFLFRDINLAGFRLTPGCLNDHDASGMGGANIAQFRFVAGDFNFDGVADVEDFRLICASVGADADAVAPWVCPDGETIVENYVHQGRDFQRLHAMQQMSPADGDMGANSTLVTAADATAHRVLLGFGVAPDQNGDGVINASDLALMLGAWGSDDPIADVNCDAAVNATDLALVLGAWGG